MTQYEAEGLVQILKRRNREEKTSIENLWISQKLRVEAERSHTMRRIEQRISLARIALVKAADEKHNARGKDNWSVCALDYETKRAALVETQRELAEMNTYYQGSLRELVNKRDSSLRRLAQEYGKEYAEIMSKVERPKLEETVNYWKHRYNAVMEELKKLKETSAA